jgi:hypothetical protein
MTVKLPRSAQSFLPIRFIGRKCHDALTKVKLSEIAIHSMGETATGSDFVDVAIFQTKKVATNAASRKLPGLTSCEAAPLRADVVDCTTVLATVEVGVVVAIALALALATNGLEDDRLATESVAELNVVLRGMVKLVPILAAVPVDIELVMFIELVAVAVDVCVVEDAMLDDPVPPTREKRPE